MRLYCLTLSCVVYAVHGKMHSIHSQKNDHSLSQEKTSFLTDKVRSGMNRFDSELTSTVSKAVHSNLTNLEVPRGGVSNEVFIHLLVSQAFIVVLFLVTTCCYHPCLSCLPWNCYDPLKCCTHASWMLRVLRYFRDSMIFALLFGTIVIIASDDCERRVYHLLCQTRTPMNVTKQCGQWLLIGAVIAMVRECLGDSVWCSSGARSKDVDDRLVRLRRRSYLSKALEGVTNRMKNTNGALISSTTVEEDDDEEDDEEAELPVTLPEPKQQSNSKKMAEILLGTEDHAANGETRTVKPADEDTNGHTNGHTTANKAPTN